MSSQQILEQHEEPHPSVYRLLEDGKTRIYDIKRIVRHRNHKKIGYQYAMEYNRNGQQQWWNEVDVKARFSQLLEKYIAIAQESLNGNASGKLDESQYVRRKGTGRPSKRPSAKDDGHNGPIPKLLVRLGLDAAKKISPGESSHGNSENGSLKMWRSTPKKDNKSVGTSISTPSQVNATNTVFENEVSMAENMEDAQSPSTRNTDPDKTNAKIEHESVRQNFLQHIKKNPFSPSSVGLVVEAVIELHQSCTGAAVEAVEAKRLSKVAEIQEWKSSYEAVVNKMAELEKELEGTRINLECMTQDRDKKEKLVTVQEKEIDSLKTENKKKETEKKRQEAKHLKTLKDIVGENNYTEIDDVDTLTQTAKLRSEWLNQYLKLYSFAGNGGVDHTKKDPR